MQPDDLTLRTDAHPGGDLYSGGLIVVLADDTAALEVAQAAARVLM